MNQRSIPCAFPSSAIHAGVGSTRIVFLFLFFLLTASSFTSFGQLKVYPVQRKYPTASPSVNPAARTKAEEPLTLPFWDDFSFTTVDDPSDTTSNYPLDSLWENSQNTWISSALGVNAPTINVASLDGLDSLGLSYSDEVLANGFRDALTSRIIDITAVDQGSTYLSFFFQWQGNGEPPDKNDFLRVEFRDVDSVWQNVMTIYPKSSFQRTEFYDTIIQVTPKLTTEDPLFFHEKFQFRFRSFGRQSGPFDTWNVDYVYMNDGRNANDDNSFPERALASTVSSLLGRYNAVPIQHFFTGKPLDSVEFDVKNLKNLFVPNSIAYEVHATFDNYADGNLSSHTILLESNDVNGGAGGSMSPLQRKRVKLNTMPDAEDPSQFDPAADSLDITLKTLVVSYDDSEASAPDYLPIDFRVNDTLFTTYRLNNYYAYDDGSAEYSAVLTQAGNRAAYAFDMATDQTDTLAGIDIYIPPFGVSGSITADFLIYSDSAGTPSKAPIYTIASRSIQRLGINEFQRIPISLNEAVKVTERFYIGWKAPVSGQLPVGVDNSNDTRDKLFEYVDGKWLTADAMRGSLMIRPLFGKGISGTVTGILPEEKIDVAIYPNPARGEFFLQGRAEIISILSMTGQSVPFDVTDLEAEKKKVSLQAAPGLYLLKLKRGNLLGTEKIVVY